MIVATNITAVIEDPQDKVNKQLIKDDLNLSYVSLTLHEEIDGRYS
jgi:hypothetical protein